MKIAKSIGMAVVGFALVPALAFAQQLSTSTVPTVVNNVTSDVSQIVYQVIGGILALMVALLGLGWGVRRVKRYITGRKF